MDQIGYTIIGTTDLIEPIHLTSKITAVIRSLTLAQGTWFLNAIVNAESTNVVCLLRFKVGFSGGLAQVTKCGINASLLNCCYGSCLSHVAQINEPTVVNLEVNAVFTTSGGDLTISNIDDEHVRFTATRLA